jgi:hypothetical protein
VPYCRLNCAAALQHFIQRAGPEILVRDLPPKQELLLALAPTPSQYDLLQALMGILEANGRSLFRDIEVGRGWASSTACVCAGVFCL